MEESSAARIVIAVSVAVALLGLFNSARAQANVPTRRSLIDLTSPAASRHLVPVLYGGQGNPKGTVIEPTAKGLEVHFPPHQPGDYDHPGFHVMPADGRPWDLSSYGHMEAKVTNTGTKILPFVMQVEDGSGGLNNLESMQVKPGETKVLKVVFGYQYEYEGDSRINLKNITEVFVFCWGSPDPHDFRLEEIAAAGTPGEKPKVDPATIHDRPENGLVFGKTVPLDAKRQIEVDGAGAIIGPDGYLEISGDGTTKVKPAIGQWDFSAGNELRFRIANLGKNSVTPAVVVGPLQTKSPDSIAPGAEADVAVSFLSPSEAGFDSSRVPDLEIRSGHGDRFSIRSIVLDTATAEMPSWLGTKPPVDGDWAKTLDDEFDSATLDYKQWNIYGSQSIPMNYYWNRNHNPRHIAHFSKDNLLLNDGHAIIRLEKKTGRPNDMPTGDLSDYSSALLTTYGKWTQRYGYFETRVKLPVALGGVWATFALIPDRGKAVTPKASRISSAKLPTDTGSGGTEFDVLDDYSGQGPNRVNATILANKVLGTANPYVRPDKDGFLTVGLLWLPGKAAVYYNGKEALRVDNPRVGDVEAYLKFDLVLGGMNRMRDDALKLPQDLTIDYVRVWQRKDLASALDGAQPNSGDPNENNNY